MNKLDIIETEQINQFLKRKNLFTARSFVGKLNKFYCLLNILLLTLLLGNNDVFAQTTLINPTGAGGFELGATFAANGWINSSSANNPWFVGNGGTNPAGAPITGNRAFVSSNNGVGTIYDVALPCVNYFYRDVTVPAGETKIILTFNSLSQGETTWDMWQVFTAPTTITPMGINLYPSGTNGAATVPAGIAGATFVGTSNVGNVIPPNTVQNITLSLPANLAGTTFRLIFAWKSDTTSGAQPPSSIDNISLTSSVPAAAIATAQGGLWSSPATWANGIVPNNDNVTIPAGTTVYVDQVTNSNSLTINGNVNWAITTSAPMNVIGNLTIGATGQLRPFVGSNFQSLLIGGDFVNNGYANLTAAALTFNGSQVGGSTSQNLSGSGTFEGSGSSGIIRTLSFQSIGSLTVSTTQNLIVTSNLNNTAGTFNTNGKITVDNTAQVYGSPLNTKIAGIAITNMGVGYATAPVVFGAAATLWTAAGAATINTNYFSGNNVYLATAAGTFDAANAPTHTAGSVNNGNVPLLWIGTLGTLGNPFITAAPAVGTQYFYGNNLYVCTVSGTPDLANPPTHITGSVVSGGATFLYVGSPARVALNYNATTQTVRSLTVLNEGSGLSAAPSIAFLTTSAAPTTAAAATVSVFSVIVGPAISTLQKSGGTTFPGGLTINSTQNASAFSGVGAVSAGIGGVNYTIAPTVGFSGPTAINLVTNGGSGYAAAPTVVVSGGNLVSGTALTTSNFTITVAGGKVVSVFLNLSTTATYSVLPTLTFSAGNATLAFPANCLPAATAIIGSNGQITNFTVTNAGFGYVAAPTVGVGIASGTPNGGTFTTVASTLSARIALYNLQINTFLPLSTSVVNNEGAEVPVNRKINNLNVGNSAGANFTGNLSLLSSAPLTLTSSILNFGANTLTFENPLYSGAAGSPTAHLANAQIKLNSPGGSVTRTFPFDAAVIVTTGTGSLDTGATVTSITASRIANPTGNAIPGGNAIGTRAVRLITGVGESYGTLPTVQRNYNGADGLASDNQSLSLSQSSSLTGPWTVRSAAGTAGALSPTGSRITATTAPGPVVMTGDDYFAFTTTFVAFSSAQTGNWNVGSTWVGGVVPPASCENVVINANHVVTSSTAGNVSKTIIINQNGTLVVSGGDLTVGCTLNNNSLVNNGTLTITGGALNVNGNVSLNDACTFNMSGGNLNIDPNDGTAVGSVASGVDIFSIGSSTIATTNNVTGGTILINDPPFTGSGRSVVIRTASSATFAGSTIQFGGTSNLNITTATNGFQVDCWVFTGRLAFGNMIVNGNDATKFVSDVTFGLNVANNLTINANSELRLATANSTFAGNITNNGILTTLNPLTTGLVTGINSVAIPSPNAQIIGGSGIFRNLVTGATANLGGLTINNSNAAGVTLNVPLSTSSLSLAAGKLVTSNTNLLTLGTATAVGLLLNGSSASYVDGPLVRTFVTRPSAATYDATTLFPIGKGSVYQPISVAPTTTGVVQMRAETFTTNAGTIANPIASMSNRRWETSAVTGNANLTNAFVRISEVSTTANDVILKSTAANGAYTSIAPIVTTVASTTLTSATEIAAADLAFLSFGTVCTTPAPPTVANTSQAYCSTATVANLMATPTGSNTIVWYAANAGGSPIPSTTVLANGNYFAAQIAPGGCESTRVQVTVTTSDCSIPYANVQFPGTATIAGCQNQTFFARVYKFGVTEAAGPGTGITMWVGISTTNSDPSTWPESAWQLATFNVQVGNDDEFQYTTSNLGTGTYYVASRARYALNPSAVGPFIYGGFSSNGGGAWNGTTNVSAVLTVFTVAPPTASATQTICNSGTVADLVATGSDIKWYTAATGGTALASTTVLSNGNYFASQTQNTCESPTRTAVAVTISTPAAPTANAQAFCNSGTVANLVATGSNIKWYSAATGGTALAGTTALVAGNYFASQTIGTCESLTRTSVAVTINTPAAPTANAQTFCNSGTVADLVATGSGIKWYTAATGGTALTSTTALASGNYFASQTIGTCESATRVSVAVTINMPAAPTASAQSFCNSGTVADLVATGSGIKWYAAATGGTALASTTALAAGNYFASQTVGTCESMTRTSVAVTINTPAAPTANAQVFCNSGTVANLVATGSNIKWYSAATGGTALVGTTALVAGNYFASQTIGTCESLTRTSVAVSFNTPAAPTASAQSFCNSATVANLVATGSGIKWYTASTGGTALANSTALASGTYFASQTVGTCESATRVSVAVTINAVAAPSGSSTQSFTTPASSPAKTIADLVATGTSVVWFASNSDALANINPLPSSFVLVNNATYFAMQTVGSCRSGSPLAVLVTITLDIRNNEFTNLEFYPNPVTNKLTISNSNAITSLEVSNMLGQRVGTSVPNALTTDYDMSNLQAGTYLIRVTSEGKTQTIKVIKN